MTKCENCGNEHTGEYGSGRFCSIKCSRGFATKSKRAEINEKVSSALTQPKILLQCKECGTTFIQQRKRVFCSVSCSQKFKWKNTAYRKARQDLINERSAIGSWGGWKVRNKEPSYAEKYFIEVLNNERIKFIMEKYVAGFFIDFAIEEKRIALEIDGSQHFLHGERVDSDKRKDAVLTENGWKVFRIKWHSPNTKSGKVKLKEQISKFLALCSSIG